MSYTYKKYILDLDKKVHVYDGLVPLQLRDKVFTYINSSMFRIGWADGISETSAKHKFLYSTFTEQEALDCGLIAHLYKNTPVAQHIDKLSLVKSMINLSVPSDTHFAHAHPEKLVVLYYANMEWEQHWHGETLFYSEDLKNIELALPYTPGRVVVFDASIPHSMRPQSISADHYRFTYASVFDEESK